MGRVVVVAYRPKPGCAEALEGLVRRHHSRLQAEKLVTDRRPVLMRAGDGTLLEIFEWQSAEAIAAAHRNRVVQTMWEEFEAVCEYAPVAEIEEARHLFSEFTPIN